MVGGNNSLLCVACHLVSSSINLGVALYIMAAAAQCAEVKLAAGISISVAIEREIVNNIACCLINPRACLIGITRPGNNEAKENNRRLSCLPMPTGICRRSSGFCAREIVIMSSISNGCNDGVRKYYRFALAALMPA